MLIQEFEAITPPQMKGIDNEVLTRKIKAAVKMLKTTKELELMAYQQS